MKHIFKYHVLFLLLILTASSLPGQRIRVPKRNYNTTPAKTNVDKKNSQNDLNSENDDLNPTQNAYSNGVSEREFKRLQIKNKIVGLVGSIDHINVTNGSDYVAIAELDGKYYCSVFSIKYDRVVDFWELQDGVLPKELMNQVSQNKFPLIATSSLVLDEINSANNLGSFLNINYLKGGSLITVKQVIKSDFKSKLLVREFRKNIYVKSESVNFLNLENAFNREMDSRELMVLSFIDNFETDKLASEKLGSYYRGVGNDEKIIELCKENSGKTVILLGHVEGGVFVKRNSNGFFEGSISLDELRKIEENYNVNIFPLGCETGFSGDGVINKINSLDAVNSLAFGLNKRNSTVGEFLESLVRDSRIKLIISEDVITDRGYLAMKKYRVDVFKKTAGGTASLIFTMLIFAEDEIETIELKEDSISKSNELMQLKENDSKSTLVRLKERIDNLNELVVFGAILFLIGLVLGLLMKMLHRVFDFAGSVLRELAGIFLGLLHFTAVYVGIYLITINYFESFQLWIIGLVAFFGSDFLIRPLMSPIEDHEKYSGYSTICGFLLIPLGVFVELARNGVV